MTPELNADTKAFWQKVTSRKKEYPFWCVTPEHTPRSEFISKSYFHFIRLPQASHAYWGFKEHDKRNEFQRRYDATPWSPI